MSQVHPATCWRDYIVCDPAILCGKPTLRGTRMSVELGLLAAGWTREQLAEDYPNLTEDRIRAVLCCAAEVFERRTLDVLVSEKLQTE